MFADMANISLKLRFAGDKALGPGKIRLLELIEETGSISGASRVMRMSYPRAWKLVDELNAAFTEPLVITQIGGATRGGAKLTRLGHDVVRRYRSIEARIYTASAQHLRALEGVLAK
jgi:molybdate transport system regulatory protein